MKHSVSIHVAAEVEFSEAADFYDLKNPGLGNIFTDEVQRALDFISKFPDAAPIIRGKARRKPLVRFPYSLIYSVSPEEIRLLAVAHQKRRPFYWRGRH